MSEMFVVHGAILGCTGCMDSLMRNSGPGLIVISQRRPRRINDRPIATDRDIGIAIPPFPHCDVLGTCTPIVTAEWIETDESMSPPTLIFGESITFCDAGCGIIGTMTSGQNPGEETLSHEEEVERVFQFLKLMNELGKEAGGWKVGELSDVQLRRIATDYVDVMRLIAANRDANGYVVIMDYGKDTIDAISRLTGFTDVDNVSYTSVCDSYNTFLTMHGQGGSQWPMVNSNAVFGLAMDRAIPNSMLKDLLIGGAIVAAISLPLWGPPVAGALTTGAKSAWAALQPLLLAGGAKAAEILRKIQELGVASWQQLQKLFQSTMTMRDQLLQQAQNSRLINAIDQLYRPGATIGDGGTADAIRYTINTGQLVGGSDHLVKGQEMVRCLQNILRTEVLSSSDTALLHKLLNDLLSALGGN